MVSNYFRQYIVDMHVLSQIHNVTQSCCITIASAFEFVFSAYSMYDLLYTIDYHCLKINCLNNIKLKIVFELQGENYDILKCQGHL